MRDAYVLRIPQMDGASGGSSQDGIDNENIVRSSPAVQENRRLPRTILGGDSEFAQFTRGEQSSGVIASIMITASKDEHTSLPGRYNTSCGLLYSLEMTTLRKCVAQEMHGS